MLPSTLLLLYTSRASRPGRTCAQAHNPPNTCIRPGTCVPPKTKYSAVTNGPAPGLQWDFSGGFCGSFSVQQGALSVGAWISQDKVRKANRGQKIPHHMHGNPIVGYEVMPSNVKYTATSLRLVNEEFDYTQPPPQAKAWKVWAKKHLVQKHPLVFFPMCKGDAHQCYPESCPNGGKCDHVESMYGIYSNHPLTDLAVYDDDVIVHTSNQDCFPYYRTMSSLEDSAAMEGNCKDAIPGWGNNEMYPCIDQMVTYGLAITGVAVNGTAGRTSLTVKLPYEPNVRDGEVAVSVTTGNLTVVGLTPGKRYTIAQYVGTEKLPAGPPFSNPTASVTGVANADGVMYHAAPAFMSDQAVYHITFPAVV